MYPLGSLTAALQNARRKLLNVFEPPDREATRDQRTEGIGKGLGSIGRLTQVKSPTEIPRLTAIVTAIFPLYSKKACSFVNPSAGGFGCLECIANFLELGPALFHSSSKGSQRASKSPLTSPAYTVEVDLYRPARRSTSFG